MSRIHIANPQEYAGRVEGAASPSRLEPHRLPPPVGPLHFALAAFAGAASWLVVLALVALLRWLS